MGWFIDMVHPAEAYVEYLQRKYGCLFSVHRYTEVLDFPGVAIVRQQRRGTRIPAVCLPHTLPPDEPESRIQPVSGNPSEFLRIQLPPCRGTVEVLLFSTGRMRLPQIGLSQGRHLPQGRLGVTAGIEQPAVRKLVRFAIAELFPEYAVHVALR